MIDFDFEKDCSGCGACANLCPVRAIAMRPDDAGFNMPVVNKNACINCDMCNNVCPHLNRENNENQWEQTWLYQSKNAVAKYRSSSGAAFFELARKFIEEDGYVCGCAWDDNLQAKHIVSNKLDDLFKMQGSKYVQSDTNTVYREIVALIKKEQKVLFSGVPCQCVAISNYVSNVLGPKYRDFLLTVGVICHGVPSPLAWESYKRWINKKQNDKLVAVNFRDKSKEGYKTSYCRYDFESGHVVYQPTYLPSSKYIEATLVYNLAIRNSCSHCDAKGKNRNIDLLIGDWYAEFKGEGALGTSCIVSLTIRGNEYVVNNLNDLKAFSYEEVLKHNSYIENSVVLPQKREIFLKDIDNYKIWDKVERLYPPKYPIKKVLVKTGIYNLIKGKV